jgi:hypothetical protein
VGHNPEKQSEVVKTWIARGLIGLVLLDNFQAALFFLIFPNRISPGFGLTGLAGKAVVQGIGLLFLMWCVPYCIATWDPVKHKVSFIETLAMQTIALVGETILLVLLPAKVPELTSTVQRFILFDGIGLLFLVVAAVLLWIPGQKKKTIS